MCRFSEVPGSLPQSALLLSSYTHHAGRSTLLLATFEMLSNTPSCLPSCLIGSRAACSTVYCICYRSGCGLELARFVFVVLSMLYPNDTLAGFAKATKTCPAAKRYWRPLNSRRSLLVLKWTSESEYFFLSFKNFFLQTLYTI